MTFLGPLWLVSQIDLISLLLAGAFLVYFGSVVHGKIIIPFADWVRDITRDRVNRIQQVSKASNFIANSISTIFFLLYVYFGAFILAEYIFEPILFRLKEVIIIITIILFLVISYAINNIKLRKQFMSL